MVDAKNELARLIDEALTLADDLDLSLVSIQLEGARIALAPDHGTVRPRSRRPAAGTMFGAMTMRPSGTGEVVQLHGKASLEQLLQEHEALDIRRKSLLQLTRQPPDPAEAGRQLAEFRDLIQVHRATERRCVYGPLQRNRVNPSIGLEGRLDDLTSEIDQDWGRYLNYWDEDKIAARWAEFTLVTTSVLHRAGDRMRLEERVIYPLAFISGGIDLRGPVG